MKINLSKAIGKFTPLEKLKAKRQIVFSQNTPDNFAKTSKAISNYAIASIKIKANNASEADFDYEALINSFKKEFKPMLNDTCFEIFEKNFINKETIIIQKELLNLIKNMPIKIGQYELFDIFTSLNARNFNSYQKIFTQLQNRGDLNEDDIFKIIRIINSKAENIFFELLQNKNIPTAKIIEYCQNPEIINGQLSKDDILKKLNNDSFIKTIRNIKNSSIDLTPKNTTQKPLNPRKIDADALALVHMTKYEPENGTILSTRDKLAGSRNSVHFSLNHAVKSHRYGNWDNSPYAIIMPYNSTVKLNGCDKFIEGMPNDIYTDGSVKIPKGSIIMKHNPNLESGAINISQHPSIDDVKILETSTLPHDLVPYVLEKMGYSHMETSGSLGMFNYNTGNKSSIDEVVDNFSAWKNFCDTQGIRPTRHTGSAGDIAEKIIEFINKLCINDVWFNENNNRDYKKEILKYIDYVISQQQKGYFVSYNPNILKAIVNESETPIEAVSQMYNKLGFHPTKEYDYFSEVNFDIPIDLYSKWHKVESNPSLLKEFMLEQEEIF